MTYTPLEGYRNPLALPSQNHLVLHLEKYVHLTQTWPKYRRNTHNEVSGSLGNSFCVEDLPNFAFLLHHVLGNQICLSSKRNDRVVNTTRSALFNGMVSEGHHNTEKSD
jgi:hypothetical protein